MELTTPRLVGIICGLMFGLVLLQAAFPPSPPDQPPPQPLSECIGDPIPVDYTFSGWLQPHECAVQCDDDLPRFILYSDGTGAQCDTPPACNDWGEDKGILCTPPVAASKA